jgi:uncharacterized protein YdeI (YjbR/CyaY-like superfamily)
VKKTKTLYVTNRDDWRSWLEKNHQTPKEVWLIYYKRHTAKSTIPYDHAVEEALCFGWIDSIIKRIDDQTYARKFTPRKAKSTWSQLNIRRARKMMQEGKMTKAGLTLFKEIDKKGLKPEPRKKRSVLPSDLKQALAANKKAWENFTNFAPSYKRLYVGWIMAAKRSETREKRIKQTVKWAAENKKPGMM